MVVIREQYENPEDDEHQLFQPHYQDAEEEYKIDQNADMNYSNAHLNVSKHSNPPNKEE